MSILSGALTGERVDFVMMQYDELPARLFRLFRRALDRAVGTKHATVARLRLQNCFALRALVEELTSIGRHHFFFCETALRAGNNGFG